MIRWITDFLGTGTWRELNESHDICILDVRELVDKGGNPREVIRSKIEEALQYLCQGRKVVVCCDYGISRSNAIAVGILSRYEGISLHDAIERVIRATGEAQMRLEVLSAVREALSFVSETSKTTKMATQQILLTGGTGFIGSTLLGFLKPEWKVIAPSRHEIDLTRDVVKLDLLVKEGEINTIVHLANPRIYGTNESLGTTLLMLKNVLDVCVENKLHLVYLSSWEVYSGYRADELWADESLPPCPGGTYGQTKLLCEVLIDYFHHHYGLQYTLLRSSPVYGLTGERPKFIWNFLEKAVQNKDIVAHKYLNGFPKLDLLYVDDLCRAVVCAIEHGAQGAFNIGTGVATSTTEVAQWIIKIVGSQSKARHLQIEGYTTNIVMDYSRASAILGWCPTIEVHRGLEALIKAAQLRRGKDAKG